ncbi:hypothetical protein Tco_0495732 [Tanacetum coccineum]
MFLLTIRRIHSSIYGVSTVVRRNSCRFNSIRIALLLIMSFMTGTLLDPFQFSYPKRRLTMEELVNKFIEEGKQEHEEMDAFIREFRTTNELLLKERNNSLSELEFEVYELSRAINKAQMVGYEAKGVTTRGGESTTEPIGYNTNTNKNPLLHHDKPTTPDEILTKTEHKRNQE